MYVVQGHVNNSGPLRMSGVCVRFDTAVRKMDALVDVTLNADPDAEIVEYPMDPPGNVQIVTSTGHAIDYEIVEVAA